jgi:hypothetical protein
VEEIIITKEFCKDKTLVFYPKSEGEATFIQKSLFAMGFNWSGASKDKLYSASCVTYGIELSEKGNLYISPTVSTLQTAVFCTAAQFDPPFSAAQHSEISAVSTDRNLMLLLIENFNQMAKRIDDLAGQVADIKAEIAPKHLQKDNFKNK